MPVWFLDIFFQQKDLILIEPIIRKQMRSEARRGIWLGTVIVSFSKAEQLL